MERPQGGYHDPALTRDEKADGGFKEAIDRYAEVILKHYGIETKHIKQSPPPKIWPQLETADTTAEWIRKRTWEYDTWKAGAVSEKMVYFLYQWYLKGDIGIAPLVDAVKVVYELQDNNTGLWSNRSKSNCTLQNKINGTFKLMGVISRELQLPLLHSEKMVDTLLDHMTSDYYEGTRSGCDELDNIFTLAIGSVNSDGYRSDEVQKMAAYSISLIKKQYFREDGGFSFYPDYCQHNWLGFEVLPIILQGDERGAGVHCFGLSVAVGLAGLGEKLNWHSDWRDSWRKARIDGAEEKLQHLRSELSDIIHK